VVGQRQQIVEELAARVAPAGMFGNERRLETIYGALDAREVRGVDAVGGSESKPTPCRLSG